MAVQNLSNDTTLSYLFKQVEAKIKNAITAFSQKVVLQSSLPLALNKGGTGQTAVSSTTTLSQIITPASGITISLQQYAQWGRVAQLFLTWSSSSTISAGADGNITNVVVGTMVAGKQPKIITTGTSYGDLGGPAFYVMEANGKIQLGAVGGTGAARTIAANTTFHCGVTFILP